MTQDTRIGVVKSFDDIVMNPAPIEPTWVISGEPTARSGNHSHNIDGWASTNIWDCTAGRFRWHFGWEETVMILEGEVHVTNEAGYTHVLTAGSIGYFPGGTWWTWEVPNYVRKIAFCRALVPGWARAISKGKASIGTQLRGELRPIATAYGFAAFLGRVVLIAVASACLVGLALEAI